MDLLLGVAPKPAPAANLVEPLDGHALPALLEETGDLLPAEPVADATGETPAGGPVEATETTELPAADTVIETVEPELPPAPKKARRSRKRAPTVMVEDGSAGEVVAAEISPAPAEAVPAGEAVVAASPLPVETPAPRRRRDPDEVLEPAYVPIKVTVSIPAVVLSELIRTVQTIRRMTGRRQPVNQGTVIAAALEMAFEEFRNKGATSQLVDKLREE